MKTIARTTFTTVKTEGGILPADLLQRITEGRDLEGLRPEDYHLFAGERLNEAINRAWNRCLGAWQAFDAQRARLPESDRGTRLTRERWLLILFQELGYGRLQYAGNLPLTITPSPPHLVTPSPTYPISHLWGGVPIHLVSFRQDLDRRPQTADRESASTGGRSSAVGGQAFSGRSPHSLMQEFLNRSDDYLWGIVSNGLRLRVLRDNVSLTRAAFVEFDLEALFTGEHYADFTALWLLCHQSRVENGDPSHFWLERWSQTAAEQGVRALDALRDGVQEAIAALGRGFLAHRANAALRARLKSGALSTQDYYRQLLRVVYRLIFLLVAEERELLLVRPPTADGRPQTADGEAGFSGGPRSVVGGQAFDGGPRSVVGGQAYTRFYSISRLRDLAATLRGGPHVDLYRGVRLLFTLLREGYAPLRLPGLGSFLFSAEATPDLDTVELANGDLLAAIRALTLTTEGNVRRAVDYRNLGSEELGSVYESLLELHPQLNVDAGTFTLASSAGSERKTTGSYYTPGSLIQALLDTALEPVIRDRLTADRRPQTADGSPSSSSGRPSAVGGHVASGGRPSAVSGPSSSVGRLSAVGGQAASGGRPSAVGGHDPEAALLSIKVVDPACGSGHFLIAAAHRLAHHLAQIRTGDAEPAPADLRAALRDVVRHCIHGVDLNPMAVELCKVALWMETLDPGKPLSFLERNLQCGNSVIGVGPGMPIDEIPDEAFQSVAGDDAATAAALRKRNKREREGQFSLWQVTELNTLEDLARWRATQMAHLETLPEDEVQQLQMKEETYRKYLESKEYQEGRLIYDLWTAAFFWPIPKGDAEMMLAPTHQALVKVRAGQRLDAELVRRVQNLAAYHRFFHWEAAFPEIYDHEGGGFDVVLGNPPWERTAFEDLQFFTTRSSEITKAATTAIRKRMIANLERNNSALFAEYEAAKQAADREGQFFKTSNRYTLGASGRLNTYALFADLSLMIVSQFGKIGIIVQTGIATDAPMESFWGYLVESRRLVSIVDFENRKSIFPGVHQEQKFCLLCVNGKSLLPESTVRAGFWLQDVSQLSDPNRVYMLPLDALVEINPNTQQPPVCHNRFDFDLVHRIQRANATMTPNYESQYYAKAWRALITAGSSQHFKTFTQISDGDMQDNGVILHAGETFIPLIEGKLIHQHDWAYATFHSVNQEDIARGNPRLLSVEERGPFLCPFPRYWAHESIVEKMYRDKGWEHNWIIGVRDVTNVNNERTAIACILPRFGLLQPLNGIMCKDAEDALFIVGVINSFALDYVSRQKIPGRHLNITIFSQLPIPPNPRSYSLYNLMRLNLLEITYTSWHLSSFANECGYDGPPFVWNEERRFLLRCELDAAYFHLYGIAREDVDYIMETFPIVKRKDEAAYGEYRTKRVILEMYDEMGQCGRQTADRGPQTADGEIVSGGGRSSVVGGPYYHTRLDPPAADPRVAHKVTG